MPRRYKASPIDESRIQWALKPLEHGRLRDAIRRTGKLGIERLVRAIADNNMSLSLKAAIEAVRFYEETCARRDAAGRKKYKQKNSALYKLTQEIYEEHEKALQVAAPDELSPAKGV